MSRPDPLFKTATKRFENPYTCCDKGGFNCGGAPSWMDSLYKCHDTGYVGA